MRFKIGITEKIERELRNCKITIQQTNRVIDVDANSWGELERIIESTHSLLFIGQRIEITVDQLGLLAQHNKCIYHVTKRIDKMAPSAEPLTGNNPPYGLVHMEYIIPEGLAGSSYHRLLGPAYVHESTSSWWCILGEQKPSFRDILESPNQLEAIVSYVKRYPDYIDVIRSLKEHDVLQSDLPWENLSILEI